MTRRGFTLLEVVVALAITATSLVVLQRATADALRARRQLETDVQQRGVARATLAHLLREVARAVPGTLRIARSGTPAPLLEFALDDPTPALVRYRLVEDRLERLTHPRFGLENATTRPLPLLSGVRSFTLRGRDADGWHETWDERNLPTAIAFDLVLASGEHLATSVPLMAGGPP
jgi:prepilin-type N-terminal cleavage/methylation domain-containing protein